MNDKYEANPFKYPVSQAKEDKNKHTQKQESNTENLNEEEFPKLKSINIKLPPLLHKEYKKHCIEKGISIQDHIFSMIKKELRKNK